MKHLVFKASIVLSLLATGSTISSCTNGAADSATPASTTPALSEGETADPIAGADADASANAPAASETEDSERSKRYRPRNGSWYGHWTPDRAHAEDHLRAYNASSASSGGVVEYEVVDGPAPLDPHSH